MRAIDVAKLTPDDILELAAENGMQNPRVIPRQINGGRVVYVLKYGPDTDRQEVVFDRSATLTKEQARTAMAAQ